MWARGRLLESSGNGSQLNEALVKNQAVREDWGLGGH